MACLKSKLKTLSSFLTLFIFFVISIFPNCSYSNLQGGGVVGFRPTVPGISHSDNAKTPKDETAYMVKLMNAVTPTPFNWSTNTDVCLWSGVSCDSGYVDRIDLSLKLLKGTLPSGLNESLTHLTNLDLSKNSLSGPLPSLTNLNKLQEVYLHHNNFTSIPDGCFQGLIGLKTLYLSNNVNLAPWKFPTDLTGSSALNALHLDATNLRGSLPEIFDSFPNLNTVDLSNNSLNGVLPKSFAQCKIQNLILSYQNHYKLSGTIEILSSMSNLMSVLLQGNRFEGPIPDLSNCPRLGDLELADNLLTGVVPLMNLPMLLEVTLYNNFLQGPLPVFEAGVLAILGDNTSNSFCLDHAGSCGQRVTTLLEIAAGFGYPILMARSWRGNNPCKAWSFITCDGDKIITVNLTKLNLTGTISLAFSNLTDLRHLYLGDNNLWGSIPESLATLPQLEVVDVSNNNLSGKIPKFSHMVRFNIAGNALLSQANGTSPSSVSRDRPSSTKASLSTRWIAGAASIGAGVIAIFVVVIYNRKRCLSFVRKMVFKNTRTFTDQIIEDFIKSYGSLAPKKYSYSEVKRMTNSLQDKLGQGGYGAVYKASLMDGRQAAVKILSESKGSGEEFINEVASISRTSHVNIVSLLGFCYEKNRRALIYEFMSNGSLDKFIYNKGYLNAICNLDWNILFQITIGIARGLEYLHRGCNIRILHLDIKPQNILLDEDFHPKIADFGLAKICKMKESVVSILGPRGTPGYIAPEIFSRTYGGVSHKSDVYSYGMLILEVVGGRNNYDTGGSHSSEMYFPDWIYKDLEQGNIPARCLAHTEEESDMVMKITLVSLWCIQPNPSNRPSMNKVVEMLEGSLQSIPYPPKPVLYSPERPPLQFSNISQNSTHETISITP